MILFDLIKIKKLIKAYSDTIWKNPLPNNTFARLLKGGLNNWQIS
jgi:hypothetical protein